jgi:hypothetical protein
VALGSCGLTLFFDVRLGSGSSMTLRIGELIAMIVSAVGLIVTLLALLITTFRENLKSDQSGPQKLFDDRDEKH